MMPAPSRRLLRALALLALALSCLGLASCGKREWPTPTVSQDRFRWRSVTVQRGAGCVILNCEASGAWQNIASLSVSLEPVGTGPGDGCPTCPFTPRITRSFGVESAAVQRDLNRLVITVCDLDPTKTYRLQLAGYNTYSTLPVTASELLLSAPK